MAENMLRNPKRPKNVNLGMGIGSNLVGLVILVASGMLGVSKELQVGVRMVVGQDIDFVN